MSKAAFPKPQGSRQQQAPSAPAHSGDPELRQDGSQSEGEGAIPGTGSGSPNASTFAQRQALIAAATAGDAIAQCRMGDLCRTGDEFTTQDYAAAMRWYRLAAVQNDAGAENDLGAMYHNGLGVPVDTPEAAKWYRLAADKGLSTAQYNLAVLLGWGIGVPMDEPEATDLLHKAAAQGHIEACSTLGTLYRFGDFVEKRIPIAAEFHVIAALAGDATAIGSLSDYVSEIEAEALGGSLLASLCLAKMHDRGLGVEQSKAKMFAWLMWGGYKGIRDDDPDVREELIAMREFYAAILDDAVQEAAWKLFGQMWSPNAQVFDTRPRDAEGNVIREEADPDSVIRRGGG
jgi:TPR repeat protein